MVDTLECRYVWWTCCSVGTCVYGHYSLWCVCVCVGITACGVCVGVGSCSDVMKSEYIVKAKIHSTLINNWTVQQ